MRIIKILAAVLSVVALVGGFYINSQRANIIKNALTRAEKIASDALGVPVKIGSVNLDDVQILHFDETSDVIVRDVEIFDKHDELIARVDEAKINFKLIALRDDPVAALDEIYVNGATVNIKQRDDDSWNFSDVKLESEGESTFGAKIFLRGGKLNATFGGKNLSVEEISASADCADLNAVATTLNAKTLGANVKATGTLGMSQQIVNAEADEVFFEKILPLLPADKIPEGVEILGGAAQNISVHLLRGDDKLTYLGTAKVAGASVRVEKTDIEDITGRVTLNERELFFDAAAIAQGQSATASGSVRLDTDEIFFDIQAASDDFTPAAVMPDIGIIGSGKVNAHLTGTAKNPQVDAEIFSDSIAYETFAAQNVSTKLRYVGEMIYLTDIAAQIFGGQVSGSAEIKTSDLSFNANVKANALDAKTLCDFSGSEKVVLGKIFADVGINGIGGDGSQVKIYGNARAAALEVEGFTVDEAKASFYLNDNDLTLDYLSANIPNGGTLGVEGTVTDINKLDLKFYGAHVDMSLLKRFNAQLDMSGLADFKGTVHGDYDNPNVAIKLSAVNLAKQNPHFAGTFFKQPFDSIKLAASGSLDAVHVDDFALERGGNVKWTVIDGSVGLTGEKRINLQLDTKDARAEDIAALVAPDQEITGNVTNTVKITGTLENPQVAGNITFRRGSYRGVLLNGMTGDYFLEGDILRLQNFQVTSPMVDMILDGTINKNTQVMDFVVQGKDIRLERFKGKLPENYFAEGHTTFEGIIKGTPDHPIFDGELAAREIFLNGVKLTDVYGHLSSNGADIRLEDFHLSDGKGSYQVQLRANLNTQTVRGVVDVTNANIAHMLTIADKDTDLFEGKLNSKITLSGTFANPTGSLTGEILQGKFAGYDIRDVFLDLHLLNNTIHVNRLEGKQGDNGTISLLGSADLGGKLDMTLTAREIALGIFSAAAGYDVEMVGTSNIDVKLFGTVDNPSADATVTATGGIRGSTFDLLRGQFKLRDWRVNVEELIVQRELSGKTYGASAQGYVPLKALFARSKENLPDNEQLNLTVSLDGADLSLLPVMSKQISFGVGELQGSVKITGAAAHPQVNGQISMNDGSVKLKSMKTLIEHINLATVFKGERFDVENFSANIGDGTLTLTGGFNFGGLALTNYNFDLVADALKIDSDIFRGTFNAKFNFSEGKIFRRVLPKVTGEINLDKCRITVPMPDDDSNWPEVILDVSLNLGEKVHFYSSRLYDLYLTGNARFEDTVNHPKTSGVVTVKRGGTLTYLESVFNIREGEAHFNQIGTFFPSLHFFAETKIDRTKIFLMVDGTPDKMNFKLSSSPEMTETEIMRLLTLREAYSKGGGGLSATDALAIGLQMTILSDIEDALKRSLGIDQLTVSRGSGSIFERRHNPVERTGVDEHDYNVTIGKYINDKLMLRYTRGFGSHKLNRYGLQYDFNDNLGFTIEREGKDFVFTLEARYKF